MGELDSNWKTYWFLKFGEYKGNFLYCYHMLEFQSLDAFHCGFLFSVNAFKPIKI
jgi:hypothetical protein